MIAFVVPVHDRHAIATVCLRRLAEVCDELGDATIVMVGNDPYFQTLARELEVHFVPAQNSPLGKKWNDGVYYAGVNLAADHIVRIGSDDVVHPSVFADLPPDEVTACTRRSAIVSPDGGRLVALDIEYAGGDGVQINPRGIFQKVGFRPHLEDRQRALDGSITENLILHGHTWRYDYRDLDPYLIIDFKTATPDQRNPFASCLTLKVTEDRSDVFETVARYHGERFAEDVAKVYGRTLVAA